ncbi:hypothetical protein B0T14DRAFT_145639 [Immersiella caudata]|uniref:DUF6546 domain-containing protein n=1 Tax=Immersiella caudata TaxID=314043 RepID=A0AA40C7V5_9PEZI|nr:hypothetical protein B0T14DRAFT_145639 [Immersiella caudata]
MPGGSWSSDFGTIIPDQSEGKGRQANISDISPPFHFQTERTRSKRPLSRQLSKTTRRCTSLTELSASFLIDAFDVFHDFASPQPLPPNPKLRTWETLKILSNLIPAPPPPSQGGNANNSSPEPPTPRH